MVLTTSSSPLVTVDTTFYCNAAATLLSASLVALLRLQLGADLLM
jgi:hypothetical protein